jgi:CubicO group peptidase (beta-lactamase class C family)
MKSVSALRLSPLIALFLPTATLPGQTGPLRGLDRYIQDGLREWKIPGLAISIVKDDSIIFAKGYGRREVGEPTPVDEFTNFAIGSASKAFTAASIAMLVDEGRLKWDDRVTDYLPGFQLHDPYITREITVRDLLSHRSGLARGDRLWYGTEFSRDEILRRIRFLKPSWSFRSRFGYQNIMFLAAGSVIEAVAGLTWDEFVKQRIFDPLGMSRSGTSVDLFADRVNVATPHARIDGRIVTVPWRNVDNIAPAVAINSNAIEMAQWVRLHLGEGALGGVQVISAEGVRESQTPQTVVRKEGEWVLLAPEARFLSYGLGWYLLDYRGRMAVQHGGNIDGMTAVVAMMPELRLGVVILTNMEGTLFPHALTNWIFDLWLGHIERDWSSELFTAFEDQQEQESKQRKAIEEARIPGTTPSLPLDAYVGVYGDSVYGQLEVLPHDGSLVVRQGGALVGELEHWHFDTFRVTWRDRRVGKTLVQFVLDSQAGVAEVNLEGFASFSRIPERIEQP